MHSSTNTVKPFALPDAPSTQTGPVKAWSHPVTIPTYEPLPADRNPMFLEKRVYQGSNGKVYPLPFTDRIADHRTDRDWQALHLENELLRVMVLPEIGGRIHLALDKQTGYDLIYRQDVIKPALVGLAGPWISGGIEFNWPQHHRPSTFMPADAHIEEHPDGSKTLWLSEHDPMSRMKGMHGLCLHPGKALIELKVRIFNRTPFTQTFLWWANVATRVHELYQSFFPPDVYYVADHAKRAMSRFPQAEGAYYGVNYAQRAREGVPAQDTPRQFVPPKDLYPANDLSWYANIPVPTSYMCMGTNENFFGGYDHRAQTGIVHVASHHISPGKKQWTWGNHEFGYCWDRLLTDPDEAGVCHPYIEIMAGVYTDNQPDFSFLAPGETRTFSQFWYPIHRIGPAHQANIHAALSLNVKAASARIGVCTTSSFKDAVVTLESAGKPLARFHRDLSPGQPLVEIVKLTGRVGASLRLTLRDSAGQEIITYSPKPLSPGQVPPAATEPLPPEKIPSTDELYITGLHLEQYRHATRMPELYYREALRRDPLDSRCNNAMGLWHLRRGEFDLAETHFRRAIQRLTRRNPNPIDGEAHYNLGLTLRHLHRDDDAYAALYKSTWNHAWQAPAFYLIAEIDCRRGDFASALAHLDRVLRLSADHLKARDLKAVVLRKLNRPSEADALLRQTLALDPLDFWALHLTGQPFTCDNQVRLDLTLDFARAGLYQEAIAVLAPAIARPEPGTAPLVLYYLAYLHQKLGNKKDARHAYTLAAQAPSDYCFPSRLDEIQILQSAIDANPSDPRAPYYLGNLFYDRRRHREAVALWESAAKLDPTFPTVWRNLGIGRFNILHQPAKAKAAYDHAFAADPFDARILFERDQLAKRTRQTPARRLAELQKHTDLVCRRDDLMIELCALLNQTGQHDQALALLQSRSFQPWEGGEGMALAQHVRTHLALGRAALRNGDPHRARTLFETALQSTPNLGEARHLLANQSDIAYWLGLACQACGDRAAARLHWTAAASARGDFQEMSVQTFSEMTYYSALALQKLGRRPQAKNLLKNLLAYATRLKTQRATIDYFATSLPTMLLFNDDLQNRQLIRALFLMAQARLAQGQTAKATTLLKQILRQDPTHSSAADLLAELPTKK